MRLGPGHADLAGSQKFNFHDARYVLERASARETAARVAAGAFAKLLLREFGTEIASHTVQVGHVRLERAATWKEIQAVSADLDSPLRCVDAATQEKMKAEVDAALKAGNTVGGIFEIVAHNVPVGLGSHAQWDEKLDGRLAQALMSVQAVKAVEIGARRRRAQALTAAKFRTRFLTTRTARRFRRSTNRAGGLEGGITNGEDVVIRGYLKPISTLRQALHTADMVTKEPVSAAYERSDWCVVPAGAVAGEAMIALVLADAFLQKFGGDSPFRDAAEFRQLCQTNRRVLKWPRARPRRLSTPRAAPARKIYPIVKYGDPILEKPTAPVKKFDAELEALTEDMFASMYAASGVGLAAPQIGKSMRLTVVDVTGGKNPEAKIVLANPEIIHAEGEVREEEGCLSIPGFRGYVMRPQFVTMRAQNAKGESFEIRGGESFGAGFLPRNRSSERDSVSATPQHAEARPDQAQNQEAQKTGRVVGSTLHILRTQVRARHCCAHAYRFAGCRSRLLRNWLMRIVFCGTPQFAVPSLKHLVRTA